MQRNPNERNEVTLASSEAFLMVKETLERIGVPEGNILWQACHILHKKGRYFILHYKQLHEIDGTLTSPINDVDLRRVSATINMLASWKLLTPLFDQGYVENPELLVVSAADKENWDTRVKYKMGAKR